ncbi:IE-0 [Orgyia pseudotsugata single capsid nuclopolyhedrovirus]|nr:IE-0 [Orgyia pseudotsugata single capsid nuclopolyhedrovirus]
MNNGASDAIMATQYADKLQRSPDETASAVASLQQQPYHNDTNQMFAEVINGFVLADKYSDIGGDVGAVDGHKNLLPVSAKSYYKVKFEAFKLLQSFYVQTFNCDIEKILHYKESNDQVVLPTDQCVHYVIPLVKNVIRVLKIMSALPRFRYNMYIFLPYCRQLELILNCFTNDYCCKRMVLAQLDVLKEIIVGATRLLHVVHALNNRVKMMMVFAELPLYECHICNETSAEEHFLKPNECCGFNICGMCYAQLWQHCTLYPVCPVCKTSFKTVSESSSSKIEAVVD